jgi:hypothetical protein
MDEVVEPDPDNMHMIQGNGGCAVQGQQGQNYQKNQV